MMDKRDMTRKTGGARAARASAPRMSLSSPASTKHQAIKQSNTQTLKQSVNKARSVFDCEIEGLKRTRDSLGPSFSAAVDLMLEVLRGDGRIIVSGVGKSLHVAEKMSGIFSSTGSRSFVLNPVQAMHGDLGATSARDVLLALSFSGESEEILRLIPAIRRHGLKVVSLTGEGGGCLASLADAAVRVPAHETYQVQEFHLPVYHALCAMLEEELF